MIHHALNLLVRDYRLIMKNVCLYTCMCRVNKILFFI